jgi:hypothetical protein
MATLRTTSRRGARRRIFVLVASVLMLAAGASIATAQASTAAVPPIHLPTAPAHLGASPNVPRASTIRGAAIDATAPYLVSHRGAFLNSPDGAAWDFAAVRAAGFEWVALNIGDHEPRRWDAVRARAEAAGLEVVPWARLGHPNLSDTHADCLRKLAALIATAKAWGTTRPIVNVETEIKPSRLGGLITPEEVAGELERAGMDETGISTEAWLYDMNWVPLADYALLLQILPRDNGWSAGVRERQRSCEARARRYGFEHVGTSVQTYPMTDGTNPDPGWFDLSGTNRSLIWGDNVPEGHWERWADD